MLRHRAHLVDLAFIVGITLPTGFPKGAYMGEDFATFAPELVASLSGGGGGHAHAPRERQPESARGDCRGDLLRSLGARASGHVAKFAHVQLIVMDGR